MCIGSRLRPWLLLALAAVLMASLAGCGGPGAGSGKAGIKFTDGKTIHLQQVLERYDADSKPVTQYLELWLTKDNGRCSELDAGGKEIAIALDTGTDHLYFDAKTLEAQKSDESLLFIVSLVAMKKAYPKTKTQNDGQYAGRDCSMYLMDAGDGSGWVKLYVDKATGCVLLCDAPTFRLRTALIEELPTDKSLFQAPDGLKFRGGNGK